MDNLTFAPFTLLNQLNLDAFLWFNQHAALLPDAFWQHVTVLGDSTIALALLLLVAIYLPVARAQNLLALGLVGGVFTGSMSSFLKWLMSTDRPLTALGDAQVHVIGIRLFMDSMPSGHTISAFTCATVIALCVARAGVRTLVFALATLIGLSRIAVGAHWPLDVLVGALVGTLLTWFSATYVLARAWPTRTWAAFIVLLLYGVVTVSLFTLRPDYSLASGLQYAIASLSLIACTLLTWRYLVNLRQNSQKR